MAKATKSGYLPSLDGWRAISILAVMASHGATWKSGSYDLAWLQDFGGTFVYLFFGISGYLICTRILEEEKILGRLNIRGFYIRRLFRIQPAAMLYLLAVAVMMAIGWMPQRWSYWFGSLFLYRNYQSNLVDQVAISSGFLTGHFWTLAVEEHFYLLLSLFLFFISKGRERWMTLCLLVSLAWPVVARAIFPTSDYYGFGRHTGLQIQYLILPAQLALVFAKPKGLAWAKRWLQPGPVITFSIVLVFLFVLSEGLLWEHIQYQPGLLSFIPYWGELFARLWPLWIVATVVHPESFTTRLLEQGWLRWIGRLSYSLYLWHVLFFRGRWPAGVFEPHSPLMFVTHAPWNYVCSFGCAAASFYFVERPLMRVGHRLAPPTTPGHLDLGKAGSSLRNEG